MAGGGAANWTGSCDEQPVSIGPSGYAAAKYLFGLNARPDDTAKSQAVDAAKVIITGNHSNIHGGGIMTNGGPGTSTQVLCMFIYDFAFNRNNSLGMGAAGGVMLMLILILITLFDFKGLEKKVHYQ